MLFLGSSDAKMINGEIMVVDGGQSITTDRYDDYTANLKKQSAARQNIVGQM